MVPPYLSPSWQPALDSLRQKKNQNSIAVRPVGRRGGALHSSTGGWDLYLKPVAELPNPWHSPCSCLTVPLGTSMPQELFRCRIFLGNQQELGLEQLRGCRGTRGIGTEPQCVCVEILGWEFKAGFFLGLKPAHFRLSWGWIKQGRVLRADAATSRGYSAVGSAKGSTFYHIFSIFSQTESPHLQDDQGQPCRLFSASSAWPFLHPGPGVPSRDLLDVLTLLMSLHSLRGSGPHEEQNLQTHSGFVQVV